MNTATKRIKLRMKELQLTQAELADKIGISRGAITHYLAGRRIPRHEQFLKLAEVLECNPSWLQYGNSLNSDCTENRKKGGGGKMNRSEIIQARLDPKLHMAAELLARTKHRTLSNLVETLIDAEVEKCKISVVSHNMEHKDFNGYAQKKTHTLSIKEAINQIWTTENADLFALFAFNLPDSLNSEELCIWEHIMETSYLWEDISTITNQKMHNKKYWPVINQRYLSKEHLREHWKLLAPILDGKEPIDKLQQL